MTIKGKWMYNTGDEENWQCDEGEFDTKEEAIKHGREFFLNPSDEYLEDNDIDHEGVSSFNVGQIADVTIRINPWSAIEKAQEDACEQSGEWADKWLNKVSREEANELSDMLTKTFWKWIAKSGNQPKFFTMENVEEIKL
ncbi:hypothetical protein NBRC13296_12695 [Paenibacillus chitinolyticus]|uniref:hypothetical protein n=1 Tax=Paenibacillus chitinolyticus TaxID=79263 RepID=UPI0035561619